jgi:hypothetical protein
MRPDRILGLEQLHEGESYRNLIDGLKVAESCARQLALMRGDRFWLLAAATIEGMRVRATDLMLGRARPFNHPWVG